MATPLDQSNPTLDCFKGYANYPANLDVQDVLTSSSSSLLSKRLTSLTSTLFTSAVNLYTVGINHNGEFLCTQCPDFGH